MSPARAGELLTTGPPEKSLLFFLVHSLNLGQTGAMQSSKTMHSNIVVLPLFR